MIGNGSLRRKLAAVIDKARGEGLSKDDNFPHLVSGEDPRIVDKPPTIFHLNAKADARHKLDIGHLFATYRRGLAPDRLRLLDRFTMKDLAFKAVGVGSVGTFCCVGLFMTGDGEPLFLQVKQAQRSVLERLGRKLGYKGNQGRRVVEGQQMMQAASDIFLGFTQDDASGRQFYIRTLKNRRLGGVSELSESKDLSDYAQLCGRTLARAHARSGDPAVIAGYMGKSEVLDDAIASFAMAYADQTNTDYAALVKAKGSKPVAAKKAKAALNEGTNSPRRNEAPHVENSPRSQSLRRTSLSNRLVGPRLSAPQGGRLRRRQIAQRETNGPFVANANSSPKVARDWPNF